LTVISGRDEAAADATPATVSGAAMPAIPNAGLTVGEQLSGSNGSSPLAVQPGPIDPGPQTGDTPGDQRNEMGPLGEGSGPGRSGALSRQQPTPAGDSEADAGSKPDAGPPSNTDRQTDQAASADLSNVSLKFSGLTGFAPPVQPAVSHGQTGRAGQAPETLAGDSPDQKASALTTPMLDRMNTPAAAGSQANGISMRIAPAGVAPVEVQVSDRAGQIHVAVRTSDAALETTLRRDLGTLVDSLDRAGFRAQTVAAGGASSQSAPGFGSRGGRDGDSGQNWNGPGSGPGDGQSQRREQQRSPRQPQPVISGQKKKFSLNHVPSQQTYLSQEKSL
jgi:hypothetical protein